MRLENSGVDGSEFLAVLSFPDLLSPWCLPVSLLIWVLSHTSLAWSVSHSFVFLLAEMAAELITWHSLVLLLGEYICRLADRDTAQ